jgi:hypothetical protein
MGSFAATAGLTWHSIIFKKMDARVEPAQDKLPIAL